MEERNLYHLMPATWNVMTYLFYFHCYLNPEINKFYLKSKSWMGRADLNNFSSLSYYGVWRLSNVFILFNTWYISTKYITLVWTIQFIAKISTDTEQRSYLQLNYITWIRQKWKTVSSFQNKYIEKQMLHLIIEGDKALYDDPE